MCVSIATAFASWRPSLPSQSTPICSVTYTESVLSMYTKCRTSYTQCTRSTGPNGPSTTATTSVVGTLGDRSTTSTGVVATGTPSSISSSSISSSPSSFTAAPSSLSVSEEGRGGGGGGVRGGTLAERGEMAQGGRGRVWSGVLYHAFLSAESEDASEWGVWKEHMGGADSASHTNAPKMNEPRHGSSVTMYPPVSPLRADNAARARNDMATRTDHHDSPIPPTTSTTHHSRWRRAGGRREGRPWRRPSGDEGWVGEDAGVSWWRCRSWRPFPNSIDQCRDE